MTNEHRISKYYKGYTYHPLISFGSTQKEIANKSQYLEAMAKQKQHALINLYEDNLFLNIPTRNLNFYTNGFNEISYGRIKDLSFYELLKLDASIVNEIVFQPHEYYYFLQETLTDREKDILYKRSQKYTLEEVGDSQDLTRERIRQIQNKAIRKSRLFVKNLMFYTFNEKGYLDEKLLLENFEADDIRIIKFLVDAHPDYTYDEYTEKVILDEPNKKLIIAQAFTQLLENNELHRDDILKTILDLENEDILYYDFEEVESFVMSKRFKKINNYYVKLNRIAAPYLFVIKNYFKDGIELKQNVATKDYNRMVELTHYLFDIEKDSSNVRTLTARLTEHLVSIDRSIWVHEDLFSFDEEIINEVLESIKLSNKNSFYFTELFNKYEDELVPRGINNRYYLRSAMISVVGNAFEVNRDIIKKTGTEFVGLSDRLEKYLFDKGGIVYLDQIRSEFKYHSPTMLYQTLFISDAIISWSHMTYIHKLNIPKINDKKLMSFINDKLTKRKIISKEDFILLFKRTFNFQELNYLYRLSISSFLKFYFGDLLSYDLGVIWNNQYKPKEKIDQVLAALELSQEDTIKLIDLDEFSTQNELSYNDSRYLLKIVYQATIRKNSNEFYPISKNISKKTVNDIKSEIDLLLNNNPFTTVTEIYEKALLPTDEIYWSLETIASVLKNHLADEFDFYTTGNDKLLSIWGIISKKGKYESIADGIYDYLKGLGLSQITEFELNDFIVARKIYTYGIPFEVYSDGRFKSNNGIINL